MQKLTLLVVFLLQFSMGCSASTPLVIVTIKPIHSLVAYVMEGVGSPQLIMDGNESPHTYQLRPSKARLIAKANIIFWVGPHMETILQKPLKTLAEKARIVTLENASGLTLFPNREAAVDHRDHHHGPIDAHLWLSPENAIICADLIAETLIESDPQHKTTYQKNVERLKKDLKALADELMSKLSPVRDIRYLAYHDAYQYFEKAFHLKYSGAIIPDPELPLTPLRLRSLLLKIKEQGIQCLLTEPQFSQPIPPVIRKNLRLLTIDPIGSDIKPGPQAYFILLRRMADSFLSCKTS